MRFKVLSFVAILLIAGSIDARPSKIGSPEIVVKEKDEKSVGKGPDETSGGATEPRRSSVPKTDSRAELKDLRYMDQSLRTVATQLLNVTNPNDQESSQDEKSSKNTKVAGNVLLIQNNRDKPSPSRFSNTEKTDEKIVEEMNSDINGAMNFGRPVNSKFGYFESSHPGEAMAMTEEELERELAASSTRTSENPKHPQKNQATTTGGISTWILLNPPSTTIEPTDSKTEKIGESKVTAVQIDTTVKNEIMTTLEQISSHLTTPMEKIITMSKSTTPSLKKTSSIATTPKTTSPKIEKLKVTIPKISSVTETSFRPSVSTESSTTLKIATTTKKVQETTRPTTRPKITTPKSTNVTSKPMATKFSRPSNSSIKGKVTPTRRVTTKIPLETTKNPSTSKIEKVTFRPVHLITTPKTDRDQSNVEKPIFLTKLKTSFTADTSSNSIQLPTPNVTSTKNLTNSVVTESSITNAKKPTKSVLKVQLKRPTESPTSIEIEPIRVNAPILKIEKIEPKEKSKKNSTKPLPIVPENSKIDVKFDFTSEATKIETTAQTEKISVMQNDLVTEKSVTEKPSTTTRRPHKRKKNKVRRRRPSTTSTSTVPTTLPISISTESAVPTTTEGLDLLTELGLVDNTIQESKIAPESKITDAGTKNKKKQVQKPIGTQIYNFLSREVMPSFGMMSLVGLGLGLASYFLYPFSGTIARRNYVVEPNYKYNMDEYGGNYGQREEEVFSKVLQGMTNQDGKYGGIKDYENNFYRYQHQAYQHSYPDVKYTTRRVTDPNRFSTASIYRQPETTIYDKNRNEFKYPDPTTPSYYERTKKPDFVGKKSNDRQFVVGNIPKEYGYEEKSKTVSTTTESIANFNSESYRFPSVEDSSNYGNAEALKSSVDYEEIEITPSAVQVEHGPRSLRSLKRRKRESVIQLIPSRTEIEKEVKEIENEEPLSNEILDIIDSVIPDQMGHPVSSLNHGFEKKAFEGEKTINTIHPNEKNSGVDSSQKTTVNYKEIGNEKSVEEKIGNSTESKNSSDTTSTANSLTIEEILGTTTQSEEKNPGNSSIDDIELTTTKPQEQRFNVFSFVKKIAEVKLKLGVAILKHASEGFARYLGHVQKRINGDE